MQNIPIPYISLVVPTHNRSRLLRRALDSVNSQSIRKDIEVIVVSDCACADTDFLCHELLQPGDVYISNIGRPGPSASRNLALKLASGQHIMFLDDDDAWSPGFTEALLSSQNDKNFDIVYFDCTVIKESRPVEGPVRLSEASLNLSGKLNLDVFVKNQIHMSCFLFSKALIAGLEFDQTMRAYEDWDFLLSVFARKMPRHISLMCSQIFEVDDATTDRRGSSVDANNANTVLDYLYVYRRHLAPNPEIQKKRKDLLDSAGLQISQFLL